VGFLAVSLHQLSAFSLSRVLSIQAAASTPSSNFLLSGSFAPIIRHMLPLSKHYASSFSSSSSFLGIFSITAQF